MSKRTPKPTMMVNYYEKLYQIFITSGSILYHAAAWSKYYAIVRTTGLKSDEELAHCASLVLLSALAVPTATEIVEDGDETKGKHARLTTLLGLGKVPTRSSLLNEAVGFGGLGIMKYHAYCLTFHRYPGMYLNPLLGLCNSCIKSSKSSLTLLSFVKRSLRSWKRCQKMRNLRHTYPTCAVLSCQDFSPSSRRLIPPSPLVIFSTSQHLSTTMCRKETLVALIRRTLRRSS